MCVLLSIKPVMTPELIAIVLVVIVGIGIANALHIFLDKVI